MKLLGKILLFIIRKIYIYCVKISIFCNSFTKFFIWSNRWLFSTNHKIIAFLYFIFGIFTSAIATLLSIIIRIELSNTGDVILNGNHQLYNVIITAHGLLMVFFVVMPILIGGFGNFFFPILVVKLTLNHNSLFYKRQILL